jgi:hypothetical protein
MPLFAVKEDTFLKAFLYASAVVGISTAIILEYRAVDPFGTYRSAGDGEARPVSGSSILQTAVVSMLSTFVVLWTLYFLFGFGKSFVAPMDP